MFATTVISFSGAVNTLCYNNNNDKVATHVCVCLYIYYYILTNVFCACFRYLWWYYYYVVMRAYLCLSIESEPISDFDLKTLEFFCHSLILWKKQDIFLQDDIDKRNARKFIFKIKWQNMLHVIWHNVAQYVVSLAPFFIPKF